MMSETFNLEVALGNINYNVANELQIKDENGLILKFRGWKVRKFTQRL